MKKVKKERKIKERRKFDDKLIKMVQLVKNEMNNEIFNK